MQSSVDSISGGMESIQRHHDLSHFEGLPRELIWKIFDYAQESLCRIIATSRSLRSSVHEYAFRNTLLSIVDRVKFGRPEAATDVLAITIDVKKRHAPLFELRLRLSLFHNWISRVQRLSVPGVDSSWEYCIPFCANANHELLLGKCLGRRIGCVNVAFCDAQSTLNVVATILDRVEFSKLIYRTDDLSDAASAFLAHAVGTNKTEHMALKIFRIACSEPEKLLLKLSSHVRSLRIFQHCATGMFWIPDDRWVDLIVEMFSAKLDKLYIRNPAHAGFLGANCAEMIAGRFSELEKPIWFEASCNIYENGLDFTVKEYSVKADRTDFHYGLFPELKIKHFSRENEEIGFYLA